MVKKKLLILIFTSLMFFMYKIQSSNPEIKFHQLSKINTNNNNNNKTIITANVNLFDLSQQLKPDNVYNSIECKKSGLFIVSTLLCVHNVENDVYVSGSIINIGVWEAHLLRLFTNYINNNPNWLVIDVGAQIGQYSLFAAKMGRKVVAIEPFYDNILRIHKAAFLEKTFNNIVLIQNAISNKRNEIKQLSIVANNIGGQSLVENKDKKFNTDKTNKYLVETILFDDILPYLPYKNESTKELYKQALVKIDIEGFEPFAFEYARLLFSRINIRIIFMEWGYLPRQKDEYHKILAMIDFLYERKYEPFDANNRLLIRDNWKHWPMDIIWRSKIF
jgi:FkbM family methyltransferase